MTKQKRIIYLTAKSYLPDSEQKIFRIPLSSITSVLPGFSGGKLVFYVVKRNVQTGISHVLEYKLLELNKKIYKYQAILQTIDGSKLPEKMTLTDELEYKFSTLGELKEFIRDNHEFNTLEEAKREAIERDKE